MKLIKKLLTMIILIIMLMPNLHAYFDVRREWFEAEEILKNKQTGYFSSKSAKVMEIFPVLYEDFQKQETNSTDSKLAWYSEIMFGLCKLIVDRFPCRVYKEYRYAQYNLYYEEFILKYCRYELAALEKSIKRQKRGARYLQHISKECYGLVKLLDPIYGKKQSQILFDSKNMAAIDSKRIATKELEKLQKEWGSIFNKIYYVKRKAEKKYLSPRSVGYTHRKRTPPNSLGKRRLKVGL